MKRFSVLILCVVILLLTACTERDEEAIEVNVDSNKVVLNDDEMIKDSEEIINEEESNEDISTEDISTEDTSKDDVESDSEDESTSDSDLEEDKNKIRETAIELNTQGYELYNSGKYEEALDYFIASFEMDDSYLYAHYNYACTLGVLMKSDYPGWYDFRDDIHAHIKRTLEIEPDYIEKVKTDSDLDLIRKDFEYLQILGYSTKDDDDIEYLLHEMDWYINGQGVITPIGGMTFTKEGVFSISVLDLSGFDNEDFEIKSEKATGTYTVMDGVIYFSLDEKMLLRRTYEDFFESDIFEDVVEFEGYMDETGTLIIEILNYPIHNWVDEFSA